MTADFENASPAPVSHSIPTPAAVGQFATEHWDAGTIHSCSLLRSYANDVFRLSTSHGDWIVKIYRRGWRNATDAQWETELCQHLTAHGVHVPLPLAGRNGNAVQPMTLPEGERAVLLLPWLPGAKPGAPAAPELYVDFGRAAARLHRATMDFRPTVPERLLDGDYLVRDPMTRLQVSSIAPPHLHESLLPIATETAPMIDHYVKILPAGVCHGDLTLDNLHLLPDGDMGFYDFDLSGRSPFAFDFATYHGWVQQDPAAAPKWQAFQTGYNTIRQIAPMELTAAAWFNVAYQIWDLEHTIHNWTAWSGTWRATGHHIQTMLTTILDSVLSLSRRDAE